MSSEFVYINEVSPRDGLQNQKTILGSKSRLELIRQLIEANLPGIEAASFVSAKQCQLWQELMNNRSLVNTQNVRFQF